MGNRNGNSDFGQDLLERIKDSMTVPDAKANLNQWQRYKKALEMALEYSKESKFSSEGTSIHEKLNFHTLRVRIDPDTDLDGPEETKKFGEFLSLFDYVVFEDNNDGYITLCCAVENIYV